MTADAKYLWAAITAMLVGVSVGASGGLHLASAYWRSCGYWVLAHPYSGVLGLWLGGGVAFVFAAVAFLDAGRWRATLVVAALGCAWLTGCVFFAFGCRVPPMPPL